MKSNLFLSPHTSKDDNVDVNVSSNGVWIKCVGRQSFCVTAIDYAYAYFTLNLFYLWCIQLLCENNTFFFLFLHFYG